MVGTIAFVPSSILLFTAIVVFTLGDGLFQPSINSLIANAAPHGTQGRVQGADRAQQSIARMLGPLLGALLYTLGPKHSVFRKRRFNPDRPGCASPADCGASGAIKLQRDSAHPEPNLQ